MSETAAINDHYGAEYFDMIEEHSRCSAEIDRFKFEREVAPTHRLIDFGCGGGFMLRALPARERIGVEINDVAARVAQAAGLRTVSRLDEVEDGWADVIISHHALEHVDDPLGVLATMLQKLRPGGKVVIVTPSESFRMRFRSDDPNFHLFTWSPSNLGNLLKRAGFTDITAGPMHHRWPPYWWVLRRVLPAPLMHALCVSHGRVRNAISQVKAVGFRPAA